MIINHWNLKYPSFKQPHLGFEVPFGIHHFRPRILILNENAQSYWLVVYDQRQKGVSQDDRDSSHETTQICALHPGNNRNTLQYFAWNWTNKHEHTTT
jgi:hypothetical protein